MECDRINEQLIHELSCHAALVHEQSRSGMTYRRLAAVDTYLLIYRGYAFYRTRRETNCFTLRYSKMDQVYLLK